MPRQTNSNARRKLTEADYRAIIEANQDLFRHGVELTPERLADLCSEDISDRRTSIIAYERAKFRMMTHYTSLNRILHEYGLHIRSKFYSSSYVVYGEGHVQTFISEYENTSRRKAVRSSRLQAGNNAYSGVFQTSTLIED